MEEIFAIYNKIFAYQTTSYNGYLRFTVENLDRRQPRGRLSPEARFFHVYPIVVLVGNHRLMLEYYPKEESNSGLYRVRLREVL